MALFALIVTYARDRHKDHFLVECLDFYIDHFADPDEFSGRLGTWLVSVLGQIKPWMIAKEILTFARALHDHEGYVTLLVGLLSDAEAWDMEHDYLTRAMAHLPADAVHRHLPAWSALADGLDMRERNLRGHLIELFTRAGAWKAAAVVARSLAATLPGEARSRQAKLAAG